ncbi:MAG: flagellar biosynthesis protein FlhB [Desulfovibrio sp.]|jgi:flagellar biosynthetic protein FlhB|nr:flagellar biosynthesis protein FlhB [Desulfovibrio sp.]
MARDPSKTEQATPKRINKARGEGNVAKSQEVPKAISILAGLIGLSAWLGYIGNELMNMFRHFLSEAPNYSLNAANIGELGFSLSVALAKMALPVILLVGALVFICIRLQVGKLWTTKVFKPKLSKFNPINGLKRMFISAQTFIRLGKSLLMAIFIGIAPLMALRAEIVVFPTLYYQEPEGIAIYILTLAATMVKYALIPMFIIAMVDLWYTRWDYAQNLKMTKAEIKDERKQMEGDEKIKAKIRQKMMKMSVQRMMQQVPKADVVITNPTHIAVALRYNAMEAPAPIVVAMGADRVAERIKEIARENKVPLRENKPLARALYKQTEVGDMIPAELFQAVAAILAQIWKTKGRGPSGGRPGNR